MLPHVVKVEYLDGFRLRIRFDNGSEGVHDFSEMMQESGPMLEPLRDPGYFACVFIELGALTWPNGFDCCPTCLHNEMQQAAELYAYTT